jgi:NADP-dependent 3-hydroxy acid dehydrogenase YdfG
MTQRSRRVLIAGPSSGCGAAIQRAFAENGFDIFGSG